MANLHANDSAIDHNLPARLCLNGRFLDNVFPACDYKFFQAPDYKSTHLVYKFAVPTLAKNSDIEKCMMCRRCNSNLHADDSAFGYYLPRHHSGWVCGCWHC